MFDVRGQFVAKRMGPEGRLSELRYDNATKAEGTRYQVSNLMTLEMDTEEFLLSCQNPRKERKP